MHSFRIRGLLLVAATVIYLGLGRLMQIADEPHIHVFMLGLAYLVLLPVCIWVLKSDHGVMGAEILSRWLTRNRLIALYAVLALPLGWYLGKSVYCADESAYLFQASAMLNGQLTVNPPPLQSFYRQNPDHIGVFFNHVLDDKRWFGKYPPGWPFLLALGKSIKAEWLVGPLLGLLLLMLSAKIAVGLFGRDVALLSTGLLVLSPYYVLNAVGYMPHIFCSLLLALATLLFCRGVSTGRFTWFIGVAVVLGCALLVRPYTTACVYPVFFIGGTVALRSNRSALIRAYLGSIVVTGGFVALMGAYNKALTGSWWRATYAYYSHSSFPIELGTTWDSLSHNLSTFTRYGIQETLLSTFPFMFLLVIYGVLREKERKLEITFLAALFLMLVIGHTIQTDESNSRIGERYYFDCFFAATIVAARGAELLRNRYRFSRSALASVALVLLAVQFPQYVLFTENAVLRFRPYLAVETALQQVRMSDAVVFVESSRPAFKSEDLNLNSPDWSTAPVFYMPDPGPTLRAKVVCMLGRSRWMTLRYNPTLHDVAETPGVEVNNCNAQSALPPSQSAH